MKLYNELENIKVDSDRVVKKLKTYFGITSTNLLNWYEVFFELTKVYEDSKWHFERYKDGLVDTQIFTHDGEITPNYEQALAYKGSDYTLIIFEEDFTDDKGFILKNSNEVKDIVFHKNATWKMTAHNAKIIVNSDRVDITPQHSYTCIYRGTDYTLIIFEMAFSDANKITFLLKNSNEVKDETS